MASPTDLRSGGNNERQGPPAGHSHHGPRFKFSLDEMRVLKECNRESFYYRCLPIGTTAMLLTHYAVKTGYLKGSPKYGSLWKVIGAGVLGYFVGKFSYRSTCEAKIMQLPNSHLAEALKRRKQGLSPFPEIYTMDPSYSEPEAKPPPLEQPFTSFPESDPGGTWDIDEDKNVKYSGLDENKRPTIDNSVTGLQDRQPDQPFTSYDALRKQNREEYEARRSNMHQKRDAASSQRFPLRPSQSTDSVHSTNKYGDALE